MSSMTKVSSGPNHLTYIWAGDGNETNVPSATILADTSPGPLRDAWARESNTVSIKRDHVLGRLQPGGSSVAIQRRTIASSAIDLCVDVDNDLVTPTRPRLMVSGYNAGEEEEPTAYIHLTHDHSIVY